MGLLDTDNFNYVTKRYENEIKATAKKLMSDDTVNKTLANINAKLDNLIKELNAKYEFMQRKVYGEGGVDDFVKASHIEIDNISVDTKDFISEEIKNTKSHPSINAFKENRNFSAYKSLDFINKGIHLNSKTLGITFTDNGLKDTDKMHTFRINLASDETLKIVEFSFTYRQNPKVVNIINKVVMKESTVQIERVIKGKFFIIRPDLNEPQDIIVKAIIENSDNTSNVNNEQVIDVKSSKDANNSIIRDGIGPEFDLYFKVASINELDICIGKIIPYKWMIEKEYINVGSKAKSAFSLVKTSPETNVHIDKVLYSKATNKFFIVDNTNRTVYMTENAELDPKDFTIYSAIVYTENINLINIGAYTIITNGLTSIVFANDPMNYKDLGFNTRSAKIVSTGELIIDQNGDNLCVVNTNTFTPIPITDFGMPTKPGVLGDTGFIEYEPGVIVTFGVLDSKVYYKTININVNSANYRENSIVSIANTYDIEKLVGWDTEITKIHVFRTYNNSISLVVSAKKLEDRVITVGINFNDIVYATSSIDFKEIKELPYFDVETHESGTLIKFVDKIIQTTLFDFAITSDKKLFIIDKDFIYDAIRFTAKYEKVKYIDEATYSEMYRDEFKGYSLEDSILYCDPEENEAELFNSNEKFMQNVIDVYESKNGIFICDKCGVYELCNNKNLKTRFYITSKNDVSHIDNIITDINEEFGIIVYKNVTDNFIVHHLFNGAVDAPFKKIRYKYTDLYNEEWQPYFENQELYETDKKIIEFTGVLFISLVDRMSNINNTNNTKTIVYSEDLNTYKDINPFTVHKQTFLLETGSAAKNVPVTKFVLRANKYGIVNYHGFETFNTNANISDINKIKSYILVHKPKDGLTLDDYRNVIMQKLKEEALLDKNTNESYKTYEYDKDSPSSKKRVFAMNPESFDTGSKLIGSVSYSGFDFDFTESKIIYRNNIYNLPVNGKLIAVKAIDIGVFFLIEKDNTTMAYYLTRDEFKSNFSAAPYTFFTDANRVMIGERVQFPSVTNVRNDNWVEHYVSGNINVIFIALGKTVYGYYVRDLATGNYTKPFSVDSYSFEVKRDDATDEELNKSDLNSIKVIDDDVYFWNNTGLNGGLYRFDNASPNKTMVAIERQTMSDQPIIDILRHSDKHDLFIMATDAKNLRATYTLIKCWNKNNSIIYARIETNGIGNGCVGKFIECDENYFIGSHNRIYKIDNDFNTSLSYEIPINNSLELDFLYTVKNINGEIIAYTPENKSSTGFYKIDNEDFECSFSKIDVNSTNTVKYNINSIVQLADNSFKVFVDCEKNLVDSVLQFKFYSPNPVENVERIPIISSDNKRLILGFYKTTSNGNSIGLAAADDSIVVNTEISSKKIDKFFFDQPEYLLIDKENVLPDVDGGRWVANEDGVESFVPNTEFVVIDGDATVWSPYSFKNLEVLKTNDVINVYEFVPNDVATYEKVDTTKSRVIPDFNYYTKNIHGNYDLVSNVTQFEKNEVYYRRSGCWKLVENPDPNKTYYYSEDVKYVNVGIESTHDTSIDNNTVIAWNDDLTRANINANRTQGFEIENDTYEIWKLYHGNDIYRQSFANSEYPIKDSRFINGFLECSETEIALPVIIRDRITSSLTGTEDPYDPVNPFTKTQAEQLDSDILFKTLIYDYTGVQESTENSPYSVFPIYKIFNTSAGKFVIYKQDFRYNGTDIANKYSLGIISNDYKQITKIIFANTILNPENVFVYEPKDKSCIFIVDNNFGYCYLFDKARGDVNEFSLSSAKFTYMFTDDDNDIVGIDTKSITKKFSAYKFNRTTSEWEKFFENNTDIDPFTVIDNGFVIRVGRENVKQHLLIGNGFYCVYRYVKTGFIPVCSELSEEDITVLQADVDANNNLLLKLKNRNNTPANNITLEIDPDYKIKYLLVDNWSYHTAANDTTYPDLYFTNGTNSFFKISKTVIENTEQIEFTPQLIELPLVTTLPIEVNGVLYFNNCKANELNLKEDHKTNYVLYDVDGLNILSNHGYFSKMFKNEHGLFGIANNAVFRNDIDTNGNGFIKVGDIIAGSEFVDIVETNYGLFFADDKTVKKFNETTKKFETIEQQFTTGSTKINFIKQFNEGLFIASKVERLNNPSQYGIKDITAPAKCYWYNPMTNEFVDIFDLSSEYTSWKFGYHDHITDIKQTSIGVFIVVNKSLENVQNNENLSTAFDYSQVECKTYLIYNNGRITPFISKIDVLPGTLENPDTPVTPIDATSIFETKEGDIFLYGHAWYHNVSNASTSTTFTRLQLVKITEPVTEQQKSLKTYYRWVISADENEFGQNIIGKTKMYDKSDGSEEIIDTFYGPFLVRTSHSLQKGRGANIIKLDTVSTRIVTEFGEKLTGFIKDIGDTKALNIPLEAAVKLCQIGSRIFAFKYIEGNVTCAEYDVKTGGFTTLYNFTTLDILNRESNDDYVNECDVMIYNEVLFFKIFNQVYRFGDWKLKYTDSIGDKSVKFKDEVLYDLKIVFENNDFYNNLPEETDNSEIDKFVIKEVGIINPLKTKEVEKIDQYGNVNIEEVPDEDPNSDIFRHVTQMFMPHNYYNRSDGRVDKLMDSNDPTSGVPKEFIKIKNLKQLYKFITKGSQYKNLINSRFFTEHQTEVSDMFIHKTNRVLGDIEKYIKNTDCFRIELRIYPTECTADAKDIYKNTTSFADFSSLKDNEMIKPFTPEC